MVIIIKTGERETLIPLKMYKVSVITDKLIKTSVQNVTSQKPMLQTTFTPVVTHHMLDDFKDF